MMMLLLVDVCNNTGGNVACVKSTQTIFLFCSSGDQIVTTVTVGD